MAAPGDKGGFKQDIIVSTRYRNDLPPPPLPPKLLNIDTGGMLQYLTTAYTSGLVRREELNIEVDAEGGMPIDMIGVPGYFLGDESAIMAPEVLPVLDPADHALLLTPDQIRNRGASNTNVSFLRKTQYMTSQNNRNSDPFARSAASKSTSKSKSQVAGISREDPNYIRRHIQKGFDIAYPSSAIPGGISAELKPLPINSSERDAWAKPVHPSNSNLKPVGFFPLLPDLPAKTDHGYFVSLKFDKAPLPARSNGKRDNRIDVALLHPNIDHEEESQWQARVDAHEKNPDLYEHPGDLKSDWDLCVPKAGDSNAISQIRQALNPANPSRDDSSLYTNQAKQKFEFDRVRTLADASGAKNEGWRFLALSLFDPAKLPHDTPSRLRDSDQGAAAYYYQIGHRMRLKADRIKTLAKVGRGGQDNTAEDSEPIDLIDVVVRDQEDDERCYTGEVRAQVDANWNVSDEMRELREQMREQLGNEKPLPLKGGGAGHTGEEETDADGDIDVDGNANGTPERNGTREPAEDVSMDDADADLDAEGEED